MNKNNFDDFSKFLNKNKKNSIDAIKHGIYIGVELFKTHIVKTQLSGRKKDNTSLNRVSGQLANGFFVEKENVDSKDFKVLMRNRVWYGKVHQHDNFDGFIYPKNKKTLKFFIKDKIFYLLKVFVPKRLYVYEEWKENGKKIIEDSISKQLSKIYKKKK